LPWDEIRKTNYKPLNTVQLNVKTLTDKHEKRMKSSKEYAYMLEDIKKFKESEEEKATSLNEEQMKKERDENEQKSLDRDNERRVARGLAPLKKGETKPKGEKAFDFILEESCLIVSDWLSSK
jgi:carboxyl-terminal processing protease